jgi:hypothetical protein
MADSVLLLVTGYDSSTFYTRSWALDLRDQLLRRRHTCLMLDAESLCYAGKTLSEAIQRVEFVVFYGHGLVNQWTAMPGQTPLALVDVNNVQVLAGTKVYAGCCESLGPINHPSPTLGDGFKKLFPRTDFVGYRARFEFEFSNHREFRDVVNTSVINYVSGDSSQKVVQDLKTEWDNLRHDFANGRLKNKPNAIMAAQRAANNWQNVGYLP